MGQASGHFPPTDARVRPAFRLLPLPFCIAMSLAAQAAEDRPGEWRLCPVVDAVPAFPDAQAPTTKPQARVQLPTDISGDQLSGTDTQPQFSGNVVLRRGDQFMGAQNLTINKDTGEYVAQGSVRYQDASMRLIADRGEGNQNTDINTLQNVRYQLMSRRGNGGADHIRMQGTQGALFGSSYSTCPPDQRDWELRAQEIDVDTEKGLGVAHNATLHVGRFPVLYVPWFEFPIDNRRRTGLLYPSVTMSGRNGFDWRQPIYLNLAPNYDATLMPRYMSDRGMQLGGEFRYLVPGGAGIFQAEYLPGDKLTSSRRADELTEFLQNGYPLDNRRGDNRGLFHFVGHQDINSTWQARANITWISDARYFEDFSNHIYGLSPYSSGSAIGLYGTGDTWNASVSADYQLLADYTLSRSVLPYNRLPRATFHWDQPLQPWLHAGVDTEAVRFQHDRASELPASLQKYGGSRLDLKPWLSLPLQGASWYVTPTLAWRYTGYQLSSELADQVAAQRAQDFVTVNGGSVTPELLARFRNSTPSRNLPIGSIDAGLFFDRETSMGGKSFLQTLEPRLFYLRAPYRNQDDLPLFDTRPLTFSWGQLFRDNRYTGADRQTDANQLTMALTTRLIRQSDGREKLSASIGQIRYFEDSRITVPGETPVEQGKSAWVVDANYAVNDRWTIGGSYQWDPKFRRQDLASLHTRYLMGDDGVINFGYRYRRNLLEQVDLSFLYPITPAWSLVGRYYYSLYSDPTRNLHPGLLEGIAGVQWDSCCVAMRLVGRRYIHNREGQLDNAIEFQFELKGLGSAGPDTESRLRHAILGYYREDLYLVPPNDVDRAAGNDSNGVDPTVPNLDE
ncbi:MAG: LPS assembly protein LptD [Lysobacter sp.]|nr:LPS assembly protein LptD [Lysobacter sp.]